MRVCIVLPPSIFKRSPLVGLAYLAAYLRKRGHEVALMDLNAELPWPEQENEKKWQNKAFLDTFLGENDKLVQPLVDKILQSEAPLIGFSTWSATKHFALGLAERIKKKDKDRLIVLGGPECSFSAERLINHEAVDAVVCGEGEETFAELVSLYENKGRIDFCLGTLLKKDGAVVNCGIREEIKDLDSLPFPDHSDFKRENYNNPHGLSIMFYRGCLRRCAFCNTVVTWKRFRSRTASNIFQEMKYQLDRYPYLQKLEVDDTALNLNLGMLSELCDLIINSGLKINWGGSALIRREMEGGLLRKMAQAGCNCIGYGLESGSQKIIDRIGKGFKIEDAERVIRDTYSAGIETILGIIIGFPGETEDDFKDTLRFIERNKSYISWIHSPSECCIGCSSFMQHNPDKFDAILDPDNGENWRSKDGANTHEVRQRRIKVFNEFLNSINMRTSSYSAVYKQ